MPKFENIGYMMPSSRAALLEWVKAEGLDPAVIADDGTFSVHNGFISGHKYLTRVDGSKRMRKNGPVKQFFRVPQKNPLPPELT